MFKRNYKYIRRRAQSIVGLPGPAAQESAKVQPTDEDDYLSRTVQPGVDIDAALKLFTLRSLAGTSEVDRRRILVKLAPAAFKEGEALIAEGTAASEASRLIFLTSGKIEIKTGELKVRELKAPLYVSGRVEFLGGRRGAAACSRRASRGSHSRTRMPRRASRGSYSRTRMPRRASRGSH